MVDDRKRDRRGFASMDGEKQRQIASEGGRVAHQRGAAHEFSHDEAREAGRKGGQRISKNREHMAAIGRKGGSRGRARTTDIRSATGEESQPRQ